MATRQELRDLVESLPEGAVELAHQSLTELQVWPPPPPPGLEEALERFRQDRQRMQERLQARMKAGECFAGGGSGTFSTGPGSARSERHDFGYCDGDESVQETHIVHDDCESL